MNPFFEGEYLYIYPFKTTVNKQHLKVFNRFQYLLFDLTFFQFLPMCDISFYEGHKIRRFVRLTECELSIIYKY